MKKRLSALPIIALVAFSVWQYFIDGRKDASPQFVKPTEIQPKSPDTLTSDIVFADYDVLMRDDPIGQNADAPADYYVLVLSRFLRNATGKIRPKSPLFVPFSMRC